LRRSWVRIALGIAAVPALWAGISTAWVRVEPVLEDLHVYQRLLLMAERADVSTNERFEFAEIGLRLWAESPLWGHGLDQFRVLTYAETYAHNNYVELLVGLGVIGLLLYYALYAVIARRALQRPDASLVLILLLTITVWDFAAVSFTLRSHWVFFSVIGYLAIWPDSELVGARLRSRTPTNFVAPAGCFGAGRRLPLMGGSP
jgi:O-antigen ligase